MSEKERYGEIERGGYIERRGGGETAKQLHRDNLLI